jgi:hypothetical protein
MSAPPSSPLTQVARALGLAAALAALALHVEGSAALWLTWADRDLGLAGRVVVRTGGGTEARLFRTDHAVLRVPLLAIHLDRDANEGLRLDRQQHLQPVWALGDPRPGDVAAWLGSLVGAAPGDVLGWDASAFDLQPAGLVGKDHELLTSARLDNQVSCFGALEALLARHADGNGDLAVVALFDHEEVGSATATGADGAWLAQVLERRALAAGDDRATWLEDLATSQMLSADMAHAVHPNYPERHEPGHRVRLGGGPVVKHNENARYATTATGTTTPAAFAGTTLAALGNGADGAVNLTTNTNLNTAIIASGRTAPDGEAFPVSALGATTITVGGPGTGNTAAGSVGNSIRVGDAVLLINLRGTPTQNSSVGAYEILTVSAVSGATITVNTIANTYGVGGNANLEGQSVMLQRVPSYTTVSIGQRLTASPFDGRVGGVVAFRANGAVTVTGSIDVQGLGYRGGAAGRQCDNCGRQGESFNGRGNRVCRTGPI